MRFIFWIINIQMNISMPRVNPKKREPNKGKRSQDDMKLEFLPMLKAQL